MCVLIVVWRPSSDWPLLAAANRDEDVTRAFVGPEWFQAGGTPALAPRDLRAGGTWIGATPAGLAVAITNRRDGDRDARRPSRGALCRAALAQADATRVARWLATETAAQSYDSFNLFFADRDRAGVASWNGALELVWLAPGVHVLSNEHGLDALRLPEVEALAAAASPAAARARLVEVLASHAVRDAPGWSVCKHGERYGTVCSSLIGVPAAGPGWLEWSPGPPCRGGFERFLLEAPRRVR